jgi:hypothetical protein
VEHSDPWKRRFHTSSSTTTTTIGKQTWNCTNHYPTCGCHGPKQKQSNAKQMRSKTSHPQERYCTDRAWPPYSTTRIEKTPIFSRETTVA